MAWFGALDCLRPLRRVQFQGFLVLLYETWLAQGFAPAQNHAVQVDFSKTFEEVDIPSCANERVVNILMADRDIAFVLPEGMSSGIPSLDALNAYFKLDPAEQDLVDLNDILNKEANISSSGEGALQNGEGSCDVGGGSSNKGCGLFNVLDESNERFATINGASSLVHRAISSPSCPLPSLLSPLLRLGSPENESYIRAARLRWLLDRCFRFGDKADSEWKYELCVGRKVTLFKGNPKTAKTIGRSLFELGTYDAELDTVYANGTITQWYTKGTGDRSTFVIFECGDSSPRVRAISGPTENRYKMWLQGPMFCDYRESNVDQIGLHALLEPLDSWCSNFTTDGWWSYEYCHPDSLIQYHASASGEVPTLYLLGTLDSHTYAQALSSHDRLLLGRPDPSNPSFRGPMLQPNGGSIDNYRGAGKSSHKANGRKTQGSRFRFLPLTIEAPTRTINKDPYQRTHKVLVMELVDGSICDGTGISRTTRVKFECPEDFPLLPTHRIAYVRELSFCRYEILIQTPLVCPHPSLLPPRPANPEMILGYPMQGSFEQNDLTPLSWKGLDVTYAPEVSKHERVLPLTIHLEAVSIDPDNSRNNFFGMGLHRRSRVNLHTPRFAVGAYVRHRWWGYTAVILSWDISCSAPSDWIKRVYSSYPESVQSQPHYLMLVNQQSSPSPHTDDDSTIGNGNVEATALSEQHQDLPLYVYVPEPSLEPVDDDDTPIFVHTDLHKYFKGYSTTYGKFLVNSKNPYAAAFPDEGSV